MLSTSSLEMLYTGLLCLVLLAAWGVSGCLLPWSEPELDEVEDSVRALGKFFATSRAPAPELSRRPAS